MVLNKNSILESLSEGMLNSTNQINSVKRTKIGDKFVKYISNVRDKLDYDGFYDFVSTYATNSVSKYTKVLSGYNRLNCFNDYWSIECGDDSKVRDLLDTLNTPMNMFAHVNSGSLIISLLLKS